MNITASGAGSTSHAQQAQSIEIAKKAQDLQRQEGRAAVGLIEAAGRTAPPPSGDGSGLKVNVYA